MPEEITRGFSRLFRRLGRESFMALVADASAVVLLASGLAWLFFTLTGLDVTLSAVIGIATVCTLATVLLTRRWWIVPALLLVALAVSGIVLLRMDEPMKTLDALLRYARMAWWILTGYTASNPAILPYLIWLCVWGITLPLLLFVRKLFNLLAVALAAAALFLSLWIAGLAPSITAMALCIAGLVSLFPRHFASSVNRRAAGAEPLARGAMQILAVPLSILCIVLALALVPDNTASWRLRILVNSVSDVRDLLDIWQGEEKPHSDFSIASLGFQPLGGRLGGPIQPSAREYLRIHSDTASLYLRGSSRDTYTGSSWADSAVDERFRLGSLLWRGKQTESFDTGRPSGNDRFRFNDSLLFEADYTVTHMVDGLPFFFIGSRTERVRVSRSYNAIPYFNVQGEVFTFDTIPVNGAYTVRSRFFNSADKDFDDRMADWESRVEPDPEEWIESVNQRYLQLPENLPDSVVRTAAEAAGTGSPYTRALRLLAFLKDGFTYTLSPDVPPEDLDFVEHFLATKEGYCVYFATAMTVMARTQGLPARYVEGFVSPSANASNTYTITGKLAHSWVEIYFNGIGWVLFDPTPARDPSAPVITPIVTQPVEEPVITPEPTLYPVTPAIPYPPDRESAVPVGLLLIAVLLLLAPPAFWITVRVRRRLLVSRYRLSAVRRRFANRERQMSFYHRDILRQLACLDIHPEPGETLTEFARRADRRVALREARIEDATDVVLRRRYGLVFPTGEDIAVQSVVHKAMEIHLEATLAPSQYTRKRVFGLQQAILPHGSDAS